MVKTELIESPPRSWSGWRRMEKNPDAKYWSHRHEGEEDRRRRRQRKPNKSRHKVWRIEDNKGKEET